MTAEFLVVRDRGLRLNSSMRSLLGNVLAVIALAIASIAWGAMERPSHGAHAGEIGVAAFAPDGFAARIDAAGSAAPRLPADPATDPGRGAPETGPEQVSSGTLIDFAALDAPRSSRVEHRATPVEAAVSRSILPVVQPPRG